MNETAITIDVDWAPDHVVDEVAAMLVDAGVKATWFVTHDDPALRRLRQHPHLFELGIHPNFLPGSTHGESPREILRHCMELVPEARSMRSHGQLQSTKLLDLVLEVTPVQTDVSLFLPAGRALHPVDHYAAGRHLLRIPFLWEDDLEAERPRPRWRLEEATEGVVGLEVFAFHPIHVALNATSMDAYREIKERSARLEDASPAAIDRHRSSGPGPGALFRELVAELARRGDARTVTELRELWLSGRGNPAT